MIRSANFAQIKNDITGRWSFEPVGYLYLAPLHITFSVMLIPGLDSFSMLSFAVLANALSLMCCALLFYLYYLTVFKNRKTKNVSFAAVLFVGATLGLLKGLTTGYFVWFFGLETELNLAITSRVVQTTALGLWWVPTLAIVFAYRERFKLQRDTLISERVILANTSQPAKTFGKSRKLVDSSAELQKFIAGVREQLATGKQIAGENYKALAEVVRQIIQDDLRPLSHRIWEQENERLTDFSLKDLSHLTVTKYVFQPWAALPIYFLTVAPANVLHFGWFNGLLQTSVEMVVISIVFPLASFIVPKTRFKAWLHFIGMTLVCTGISAFTVVNVFGAPVNANFQITTFANFAWLFVLIFLTGLLRSALVSHDEIQKELVQLVGEDRAIEELEFQRKRLMNRELAQYLHGHVQNRLLATAIRMEQASSLSDPSVIIEELERVEELLDDASNNFARATNLSLSNEVRAVEGQWQGLVNLEVKIDDAAEKLILQSALANDIGQAVNELISNSIRHGFSSKIAISLFMATPNKLIITSFDDGLGPRTGSPGLGSFLFDSLCGNNWSLSAAIGGGALSRLEIGLV